MTKLSVKYYIAKRRTPTLIMEEDFRLLMSLHYEGNRLVYYPGIYLSSFQWDKSLQLVVNRPDKDNLNILLRNLKAEVKCIYTTLKVQYVHLDPSRIRNALSEIKVDQQFTLTNSLIRYIEHRSDSWSNTTYLKYKTLYRKLSNYEAIKGVNLSLEAVDEKFMTSFYDYLLSEGLQRSTANTYMNNLKGALTYSVNKNWMINKDYLNYKQHNILHHHDNEQLLSYLNYAEIREFYNQELKSRKQEQCRDIFCLIAFTGLRFKEIKGLKANNLINNSLHIYGKRSRVIPLNNFAAGILKKYENRYYRNNTLLPVFSEITVNKYLQSIFTEKSIAFFQSDGNREQKITIATAYNTFMANAVHFGISPAVVRKWSANKTLSRYSAIKKSIEMNEKYEVETINQQFIDGK